MSDDSPLFCARCADRLFPGSGNFYVVTIDAVADPSPPVLEIDQPPGAVAGEIDRLIEQCGQYSERELLEQVHRRMVLHLCGICYRQWIEDPTGGGT